MLEKKIKLCFGKKIILSERFPKSNYFFMRKTFFSMFDNLNNDSFCQDIAPKIQIISPMCSSDLLKKIYSARET